MKYAELNTPCFGVNALKNHHQVFQVKSVDYVKAPWFESFISNH